MSRPVPPRTPGEVLGDESLDELLGDGSLNGGSLDGLLNELLNELLGDESLDAPLEELLDDIGDILGKLRFLLCSLFFTSAALLGIISLGTRLLNSSSNQPGFSFSHRHHPSAIHCSTSPLIHFQTRGLKPNIEHFDALSRPSTK